MTKSDQLRALREARAAKAGRPAKAKPRPVPKARKPAKAHHAPNAAPPPPPPSSAAIAEATALKMARCPACGRFNRRPGKPFDKKGYMREYMRKRRAARKAAEPQNTP